MPRAFTPIPIGSRFTMLVVTGAPSITFDHRQKKRMYPVRCDCGREKLVQCENLKSGATRSCGCIRTREGAQQILARLNALQGRVEKLESIIIARNPEWPEQH